MFREIAFILVKTGGRARPVLAAARRQATEKLDGLPPPPQWARRQAAWLPKLPARPQLLRLSVADPHGPGPEGTMQLDIFSALCRTISC